jgi:lipopolysaccharide export system protein LptA
MMFPLISLQAFTPRLRFVNVITPIALLIGSVMLPIAQPPARAQQQTMQLRANTTQADYKSGRVIAKGNVQITYAARQIEATAAEAIYYQKENKIVLSGNVKILQEGNRLNAETVTYLVNEGRFVAQPQENGQVEASYVIKDTPTVAPAPASVPINPASVQPAKVPFPMNPIEMPKLPTASPVTPGKPATP